MVPNLIEMAIPVFFILIGVELSVSWLQRRANYRFNDTINDLSMGTVDQVGGAFLKSIVFIGYLYVYENHRLLDIPMSSTTAWVACLLFYDLMYYWAHRASHEVNVLWGSHIPHHQSEEYNLSVALRQGVFQGCFFWIFYLPLAFTGFPPAMFIVMASVDTLYQFWIHTRTIGKLGPLEWVFNTPSHHRVHHAKNPKYIDRNHGGMLIIWDRLFGTFKEEEEEPVYGTATPLRSWNPVWANVHYWIDLAKLAWEAPRWQDKFLVWFMKPAWRPAGLEKEGPPAHLRREFYEKYNPRIPVSLSIYVFVQFLPTMIIATSFLKKEADLVAAERIGVAGLIIMTLVCIGGILEGKRWALLLEGLRLPVLGGAAIIWTQRAFGLETMLGQIVAVLVLVDVVALMIWLLSHRRAFTHPFGPVAADAISSAIADSEFPPQLQDSHSTARTGL
ncbi:MAG: hypothetical protein AMXMBFR82_02070 [Candidatus Hydrogenedentota bacterium]